MSSPLLWGPNNTSNNLQNQVLLANGQLLSNDGPKNYIKNNSFTNGLDVGANGWSNFNTTITNKIPTGAINAGTSVLGIGISGDSTLNGKYSISVNKTTGDSCLGEGFISDAFTIDSGDRAKVLSFKFQYIVTGSDSSGAPNVSGTSNNTFAVYIYDVSAGTWIQPAGVYSMVQGNAAGASPLLAGTASGTFQTSATGTQYRLAIVCVNNYTLLGYPLYFDDFFVGPQVTSIAPAMSDWVSYTPTWTNLTVGNATQTFRWKQVGDSMLISGKLTWGSTTSASGTVQVSLPSGYSINQSKMNSSSFARVGTAWIFDAAGTAQREVFRVIQTSTSNVFQVEGRTDAGVAGAVNATFPITWATGDEIDYLFEVPIQGWSSNTVSSADTDTRVIASRITKNGDLSIGTSATKITGWSIESDDSGIVNTTNSRFEVRVSGNYRITVNGYYTGVSGFNLLGYQKNNDGIVRYITDASSLDRKNGSALITGLKSGDYIEIYGIVGTSATLKQDNSTFFSFERLSGPAVVQATETVAADAYLSATTTITTATKVTGWAVNDNSHGAFDTTNSRFVAPVSGRYLAIVNLMYNVSAFTSSGQMDTSIYKNGSSVGYSRSLIITGTGFINGTVTREIKLLAGDFVEIYANKATGTYTVTSHNDSLSSTFSIVRVGN